MSCHISHIKLKKNKIEFTSFLKLTTSLKPQVFIFCFSFQQEKLLEQRLLDDDNFNSNGKQELKKDLKT